MPDKKNQDILHDDRLNARINMTDVNNTEALVEMDPWTQAWEELAEKEQRNKKDPH